MSLLIISKGWHVLRGKSYIGVMSEVASLKTSLGAYLKNMKVINNHTELLSLIHENFKDFR